MLSTKRFNVITIIILVALVMSYTFKDWEHYLFIHVFVGLGTHGWLLFEYSFLQSRRNYISTLLLCFIIFIAGISIEINFTSFKSIPFTAALFSVPIVFLLLQRVFRTLFIRWVKREPVVKRPAPSFRDFIYIMLLYLLPVLIPILCAGVLF